jgi:FAD/FMN-containing dehydrogenase
MADTTIPTDPETTHAASTAGIAAELRLAVRGDVIAPGDASYDDARRVWNGMIDARPAAIVRCASAADVVATLDVTRRRSVPVTVRSGGHGVAGRSVRDGRVLIDLGGLATVDVMPDRRVVRIGPGATWSQVDRATQSHGLATTGGVHSGTGVGGLALGGGLGYLARAHGLTVDNLLSAQVVLADGRVVTASADEHPDLYWALRGGGGNVGVVTWLELALHEVGPEVLVTQAYFDAAHAVDALRAYRDLMARAPDEVACYALVINTPPVEPFPAELHGAPSIALVACDAGRIDEATERLAPFEAIPGSYLAWTAPIGYADLQCAFDAASPPGARYFWKAHTYDDLDDATIDAIVTSTVPLEGPWSMAFIEPMGGAIGRVPTDATAYPHRAARFSLGIAAGWDDPADDDRQIAWARAAHAATSRAATGGVYGNYLDRDEDDQVAAAYRGNLARLSRVKAVYDPENVFDQNVNVQPRG